VNTGAPRPTDSIPKTPAAAGRAEQEQIGFGGNSRIERVADDHKGRGGGYADCDVLRKNLSDRTSLGRAVLSELAVRFRRQKRFWRGSIVRKIGVLL
jgi:hypothetical protein